MRAFKVALALAGFSLEPKSETCLKWQYSQNDNDPVTKAGREQARATPSGSGGI